VLQLGRSVHVDVRAELERTERRVDRVLHGHPANIHVLIDDQHIVRVTGVGGSTRPDTSVVIDVQPDAAVGNRASLRVWLPFVLAHELDHVVRFDEGPGLIGTLLDDFVSEGLADSFAAAMFPGTPPSPSDTGLTPEQLRHYWHRAQDVLYEIPEKPMHDEWLFGGKRFPSDTGYALGTALIRSVRAHHPRLSWATLTGMPAQTLLDISHFRP
jgi:hypothetical protein